MDIEDEREEGELTDEDLEDVSDTSSVSFTSLASTTGKSTSSRNSRLTREPFRELSLTSISDESYSRETRHRGVCRRRCNHQERSAKRSRKLSPERRVVITNHRHRVRSFTRELSNVSSSSNNSDDYQQNRKLFKQLRDAVTINSSSQKLPNCSLRSRLKRMIKPDIQGSNKNITSDVDEDLELEALRDQALQSKLQFKKAPTPPSSAVIDPDLMQLRLVALKSTVLKRHHIRQRLKEGQQIQKDLGEQSNISSPSEQQMSTESKENVTNCEVEKISEDKVENITEIANEEHNVPSSFEGNTVINDKEVEITVDKQINTENKNDSKDRKRVSETIDDDEDILRAMLLTSISRNIENKKSYSNNFNLPINSLSRKIPENNNNTEKVLRHIPVVNRIIINVNNDSDSDEFLPDSKKQSVKADRPKSDMFDKNLALFLQQARAKTEAKHHHSEISRLPRQQQLEYKKLKKKLNLLTSQLKPVSVSKVITHPDENERVVASNNKNTSNLPPSGLSLLKSKSIDGRSNKQPVKEKEERLQMKGKYEDLAPLMAKISDALKAREKAQSLVKKLINELDFARNELTTSHQTYTGLVQQLMKSKESIDKRSEDRIQKIKTKKVNTSTPLKQTSNEIPCELSNDSIEDQALPALSVLPRAASTTEEDTKNVSKRKDDEEVLIAAPAEVESEKMEVVEDMKVIEMDKAEVVTAGEVKKDPISHTNGKESGFLKYSSPLDHMQIHRKQPVADPLQELCPYDLLGVCRDADCPYQHFGHAITE